MRLDNQTEYDGRAIRKIITAAHNYLADAEGRLPQWKRVRVRVVYTRTRTASGHATYNGTRMRLRFRRPEKKPVNAGQVARLAWHELQHLHGYRHGQMARMYPGWDEVDQMVEAAGFDRHDPIPLKPSAQEDPEPDQDPEEAKRQMYRQELARALEKRKEWTAKAKRAKTYLAKWRRRENRARRQLEDLGVDPEQVRDDVLGDYDPAMAGDIRIT